MVNNLKTNDSYNPNSIIPKAINVYTPKMHFSYHYQKLLTSINLIIHQYDKIFLCGPSGSGKSTLMKLLVRYMEVQHSLLLLLAAYFS